MLPLKYLVQPLITLNISHIAPGTLDVLGPVYLAFLIVWADRFRHGFAVHRPIEATYQKHRHGFLLKMGGNIFLAFSMTISVHFMITETSCDGSCISLQVVKIAAHNYEAPW